MRYYCRQNCSSKEKMIFSVMILFNPLLISSNQLIYYEHIRSTRSKITQKGKSSCHRQDFFQQIHLHLGVSHLCTYFAHVYKGFQQALSQHSECKALLTQSKKAHISNYDRQISFDKSKIRSQSECSILLELSSVMHCAFCYLSYFNCVQRICDEMDDSRQNTCGCNFVLNIGFLLNLRHWLMPMSSVIFSHYVRFLQHLGIHRVVLHYYLCLKLQLCFDLLYEQEVFQRLLTCQILPQMNKEPLVVCITGAAGQIAYSFIPQLCRGTCFPGIPLHIRLLDIPAAINVLKGVSLELQDCSYPLVRSVSFGDKAEEQFKDADVIVFLGGFPRKPGMQRKDLLQINKKIFMEQAKALSIAKTHVRCLIVANPANTNAAILSHFAPSVKKENITCLSRLDHNRAIGQIISKTGCYQDQIEGVYIFGNHSPTQYPSINNITINGKPISSLVDREWLENDYISRVQKRGGQILQIRGGSSVFSAANAVIDHLRDWYLGNDRVVSLGVVSQGDYNIPKGLWTSLPVKCKGKFEYQIIRDVKLSQFCQKKIKETVKELQQEIQGAQI